MSSDYHNGREQVLAMARLARLDLGMGPEQSALAPAEAEAVLVRYTDYFENMLGLMDTITAVDTAGVAPLYWPLAFTPAAPREDAAVRRLSNEEILANAPDREGRFFVVPRIM